MVQTIRPAPVRQPRPRQRRQHERCVQVVLPSISSLASPALIRITQDGEQAHYWVQTMPSDWGLAYRLERAAFEGEGTYDVLFENEQDSSCTCPGHTYGGYCKHVDALRALMAAGKLPLPPVAVPDEDELGERCGQCFPDEAPF